LPNAHLVDHHVAGGNDSASKPGPLAAGGSVSEQPLALLWLRWARVLGTLHDLHGTYPAVRPAATDRGPPVAGPVRRLHDRLAFLHVQDDAGGVDPHEWHEHRPSRRTIGRALITSVFYMIEIRGRSEMPFVASGWKVRAGRGAVERLTLCVRVTPRCGPSTSAPSLGSGDLAELCLQSPEDRVKTEIQVLHVRHLLP
jgi:hypothetical protein